MALVHSIEKLGHATEPACTVYGNGRFAAHVEAAQFVRYGRLIAAGVGGVSAQRVRRCTHSTLKIVEIRMRVSSASI